MNRTQSLIQTQDDEVRRLEGVIERLTFHAPDTGWTVAKVAVRGGGRTITAVGNMLSPEIGESVRLFGNWQDHDTYGKQFRFDRYQLVRPSTRDAIEAYLSGSLVDGIGPKMARRLVDHFGPETLQILDQDPDRVREVPGIGEVRAQRLRESWDRNKGVHRIMVFLREHNVGSAIASRIYAQYGDQSVEVLEREPYRLAREIRGVGFLTADRIARQAGIAADDPARVQAALLHVLNAATNDGHLYLPERMLVDRARSLLDLPRQKVEMGLQQLEDSDEVIREKYKTQVAVYSAGMLQVEKDVAAGLRRLAETAVSRAPNLDQTRAWLQRRQQMGAVALTEEQAQAVATALQSGVCVITGGPGTGKTTVTRAIADACHSLGNAVALASPTGRAAKRLQQLAGHPASTIHRLLAYDPIKGGFKHGPNEPLDAEMVIVDEASMLDMMLARHLLRALPRHGRLVLIGDADQLPSVGPGNLLADVVASNALPVCRLTEIFRQARDSDIVQCAHRLNRGQSPRFPDHEQWLKDRGDCIVLYEDDPLQAADRVIQTATKSLNRMGFRQSQVQVITPLHRGPIGVKELNRRLQADINPEAPNKREVARGEAVFREADRVLQTVNDYDKGVYNGDIGFIREVNREKRSMTVEFDTGRVQYDFGELDELDLAYALTIHKSQGSEYPAVVIVIHSSHYIMLQRNLLYTALTRAEEMACIVGNNRGIWRAIKNVSERDRFTRLAPRLAGQLPVSD